MAFRKDNKIKSNFSKISIGLASPEEILENSSGEVLKPETINYRTYKPVSYTHLFYRSLFAYYATAIGR